MPLNTPKLELDILGLLDDMAKRTENPDQARKDYARELSTIIAAFVRSGTVLTNGTATTQTGTIQ
jgi:hypothetical protein